MSGPMSGTEVLRVANCSGFFGDRLSAAREMVDGGPIDVLTGDWLAELTMGVLLKQRTRDPKTGYAGTFVTQLRDVLGECLDRDIKIVSNAGGLNPEACAAEVEAIAAALGRPVRVAVVTGDDATEAFAAARAGGWEAPHLDTGAPMKGEPDVASAYLGCWGIAEALAEGADVVVAGRVSDASVVAGPAAWRFGWRRDDWDALAGAVVAGHIIECGAQATGGNYSFFDEIPDMTRPGFPIAEIAADGSAVITKHPGTGGAVTIGTVTAQLLYEIDGPRYLNPDVVARFDTIALAQEGPDRVRVSGVHGEPAPGTVKVGALASAGWRNRTTFVLTGLGIEAKAELAQRQLWAAIPGGREAFEDVDVRLLRADRPDPARCWRPPPSSPWSSRATTGGPWPGCPARPSRPRWRATPASSSPSHPAPVPSSRRSGRPSCPQPSSPSTCGWASAPGRSPLPTRRGGRRAPNPRTRRRL